VSRGITLAGGDHGGRGRERERERERVRGREEGKKYVYGSNATV